MLNGCCQYCLKPHTDERHVCLEREVEREVEKEFLDKLHQERCEQTARVMSELGAKEWLLIK